MDEADRALVKLGKGLRAREYAFVTPTPETHRRVNARPGAEARSLRDVFGWSRPFREEVLPEGLLALLDDAGELERAPGGLLRSRVRFSSAGDLLLVHSAHPTVEEDAVFFGPDTYRFLALLGREVRGARRAVDVGCGTGAGGLSLAGRAREIVLSDVSPRALRFARVNAAIAQVEAECIASDVLAGVQGPVDLVVANPPYLVDEARRLYRDGGGARGIELSARIAREAMERLEPGGQLVLYTATPIVEGKDLLWEALVPAVQLAGQTRYEELDPDVFGEELERAAYADVERIAVVAVVLVRAGRAGGRHRGP